MGELVIHIDGEEFDVRHRLRDTKHVRYVLPEHEAEFRAHSTSRHVLADQFARLGSGAEDFAEGLKEQKGAAAGYHMSRILQLTDKVGVLRVAEALRHATRYGAFDAHAVARIVTGKRLPSGSVRASAAAPPAPVAEFLKGAGSFQRGVEDYERLVRKQEAAEKEDTDGKRGDGPVAGAPEKAPPRARGPKAR
jgi:hypothetical protein